MDNNYTHISLLIDRSGSMGGHEPDVIGGINHLLQEQKTLQNKLTISLVQFDHAYETNYDFVDINDVGEFKDYNPRGNTALYDAAARLIRNTGNRLNNMPEACRPSKVIFVVYTDGLENASTETTKLQLDNMVKHQEQVYNWKFIFLGADLTKEQAVNTYSHITRNSYSYVTPKSNSREAYKNLSGKMLSARRSAGDGSEELKFTDVDAVSLNATKTN